MYQKFFKRVFDFLLALFFLPFFVLLFIPIAILIKLESRGPVFFRQKRAGRYGIYFNIFKFRTMRVCEQSEKKGFEPGTQNRITKVGKILRKTKLDEIPQILNVLKGEMSIVGPRPEVEKYIKCYPERWSRILKVRPGITDPASVKFRNEEEILAVSTDPEKDYIEKILPQKLTLYEEYVGNISFLNDVKVIFSTILTVLFK